MNEISEADMGRIIEAQTKQREMLFRGEITLEDLELMASLSHETIDKIKKIQANSAFPLGLSKQVSKADSARANAAQDAAQNEGSSYDPSKNGPSISRGTSY